MSTTMADPNELIPASDAGLQLGYNREQVVRRIQRGELAGEQRFGRWFVRRSAIEAARTTAEPNDRC